MSGSGWLWVFDPHSLTAHVRPVDDLIDHDVDSRGDCACGPREEVVLAGGGSAGRLFVHHSLDGREGFELG